MHIEIPDPDGTSTVKKIIDREEMEELMIKNFKSKFLEVYDTPIPHAPFTQILGVIGLAPSVDDILRGTFVFPPMIHPDIIEFFDHCKMNERIRKAPPVKVTTTKNDFCSFWRPGRERISSSISNIHNGHYIAATLSSLVATITATLASIPWEIGTKFERWANSLNVALEKKCGIRLLDSLRTIHLLEADFNTATKLIFAQRTMQHAMEHDQIPASQYAKKHSRPIEAVLLKWLYYDFLRITKTPGIVISNDARGCFDRMALAIGAIAFMRLGVPRNAIKSLFGTLSSMKHFVRTAHGDSSEYYEGSKSRPLQGGGQGNGAAGPMWIAISIILLSIISTLPINATLTAALSLTTLTISAIMYVDDTDILITAKGNESVDDLNRNAQTIIRKWCRALWISGGCLRPKKCWWYVIDFHWRPNGTWRYKTKVETAGELLIPDENNIDQPIVQKDPSEGSEGLGVFLAPDGNDKAQFDELQKKISKWSQKISRGYLSRFAADLALRTTILRTVEYPIATTTFTMKQCETLLRPILKAALPKLGIARTTGRKYLHGPIKLQGCNIPNIYTELGVARLNLLLSHGGRSTQVGTALTCCIESLQLECGAVEELFSLDYKKYGPLVTNCTLKHTWEFLHQNSFSLLTNHKTPRLLRVNDEAIMTAIIDRTDYNEKELVEINKFCMYLQVCTVADITDRNGTQITMDAAEGKRDLTRVSRWNWPQIPYPTASEWAKWRGAINHAFLAGNTRFLRCPLREWTSEPHQKWTWFLDQYGEVLYEKNGNNYRAYTAFGRRLRGTTCHSIKGRRTTKPLNLQRTTIELVRGYMIYSHSSFPCVDNRDNIHNVPRGIWTKAPDWMIQAFENFIIPPSWDNIVASIRNNFCIAVTDGSYDPISKYATSCWIIEGMNADGRAKGAALTPGAPTSMDAYRAELHGIYCILICLKYICNTYNIIHGTVTIACDCDGALHRALRYKHRPAVSHPNFDILWSIFDLREDIAIDIKTEEVKGHQDDAQLGRALTRTERLNCEADHGAKEYLSYARTHRLRPIDTLYGNQWRLHHNGLPIHTKFKKQIYDICHSAPLAQHIKKKRGYSEQVFNDIDWNAIESAGKSLSVTERTWLTKHVGKYNSTGRNLLRRKYWSDSKCPRCNSADEDSSHVISCPQQDARELRGKLILQMSNDMIKYGTAYDVRQTIVLTMFDDDDGKFADNVPGFDDSYPHDIYIMIKKAAAAQDEIGRANFFDGHISSEWSTAQEAFYRAIPKCRRNGKTWAKRLVISIYKLTRKMWEHRNSVLFQNQSNTVSRKRRTAIMKDVEHELHVGAKGIRKKDALTICFEADTVTKWPTTSIETWLVHVRKMRKRSREQSLHHRFDGIDTEVDDNFRKRARTLSTSANYQFKSWRLKTHYETISNHLHSLKELHHDLKSHGWQIIE